MTLYKLMGVAALVATASVVNAATFVLEKVNTGFSIDGGNGAVEGRQIYLWETNTNNTNQNWVQLSQSGGYYSYKKENTNLCLDGGSGGARSQAVTLEVCDSSNYDQHWNKVKVYSGTEIYRMEKRNASGFSIDGNGGAAARQLTYLWNSNSNNVNQQWEFIRTDAGSGDGKLAIATAFDDGSSHSSYPASKAVDGSTAWASRWAASGSPVNLTVQLEEASLVTEIGIAWGRGNSRVYTFEVYARPGTSGSWTKVYDDVSSGTTEGIEVVDITDITAQQIRVKTFENTSGSNWTNITEVEIYGSGGGSSSSSSSSTSSTSSTSSSSGGFNLDPNAAPSDNFNLSQWYLSVPTDTDGSGTADSIKEGALNSGYENNNYFYTGSDGGMVFKCPISGYKTSSGTSYTRTELREMLRAGNTSIDTSGVNKNNWVFGSAPSSAQAAAGGVDGNMKATLAVNYVTTTGDSSQVGRVIIGQIHAENNEPIRLYYRKLPGNSKGGIYFAHEDADGDEVWYDMIGSRSSSASNPSDGIALNEVFSYEIDVTDNMLTVYIYRDGKSTVKQEYNMVNSGYDDSDDWMYFKAGVYNQNNTGNGSDYVQATFYSLTHTHD